MRRVARQVAETYLEQRQRLEYPFLDNDQWRSGEPKTAEAYPLPVEYETPQTFVLEIGSEELPVGDLTAAIRQIKVAVPKLFKTLRLEYERIKVQGTPRRVAIIAHKVASHQSDLDTEVKGPPADRAFDADGKPSKAALGFARSKGINPDELRVVVEGDRRYAAAIVREKGRSASVVLAEALPNLIAGIKFEKSMRWNSSGVSYSRPLRWLVALFGSQVISFTYADVNSGRVSRGLRLHGSPAIEIDQASRYAAIMADNDIVIRTSERRAVIVTAAGNLAEEKGGVIRRDANLLDEVANLVEQPTLLLGRFEERFLELPVEVLVAVMKKHQRYFPVYAPDGRSLLPYFITVRNGDGQYLDQVRQGNEHVILARFEDAEFFYAKDTQHKLTDFLSKLDTLTFQADLGSMLDKVRRLEKLTPLVAEMLGLTAEEQNFALRAAALSKADLATNIVVEMTSLQGIMGGQYALLNNEPAAVAEAIAEQYEAVSRTRPGLALALADRFDSLTGLFSAGLAPKGSNDPFALRRTAIQIIENLITNQVVFNLRQALEATAPLLPMEVPPETVEQVLVFIKNRLETSLIERGIRTSVVRAVLAEQGHDPTSASRSASSLDEIVRGETWSRLLDAFARCARITRDRPLYELRPGELSLSSEKELMAAYEAASDRVDQTVPGFVAALRGLEPAITRFFDNVLVMDEDVSVRHNRLALLQRITGLARGIVDLSFLEGF
jgi:glycyl-tRNA synthetase